MSAEALAALREAASLSSQRGEGVLLVGGAVRDLLLGVEQPDLDLVVEAHDVGPFSRSLARRLGGEVREHAEFLTASVRTPELRLDLAATRSEVYPRPGALPRVRPADLATDLRRRDFTVNTLAVRLGPSEWGGLIDPLAGRADLAKKRLRVLHGGSFDDDPTRILRAADLEARRGLRMDSVTEGLARDRLAAGVLVPLSGERLRRALFVVLRRPTAAVALARLADVGFLRALEPRLASVPGAALGVELEGVSKRLADRGLEGVADPALVWLLGVSVDLEAAARANLIRRLALAGRAAATLQEAPGRLSEIRRLETEDSAPHQLVTSLDRVSAEELVFLAATGSAGTVLGYLERNRVRLKIRGRDLVALGCDPGPRLGEALAKTRAARIDGKIGENEELEYARALLEPEKRPPNAN